MDRSQLLHRLYFNDDALLDQQIDLQHLAQALAFVNDWHSPIVFGAQPAEPKFAMKAFGVNGLKQARSQNAMHFNGAANYLIGDTLDIVVWAKHPSMGSKACALWISRKTERYLGSTVRFCNIRRIN